MNVNFVRLFAAGSRPSLWTQVPNKSAQSHLSSDRGDRRTDPSTERRGLRTSGAEALDINSTSARSAAVICKKNRIPKDANQPAVEYVSTGMGLSATVPLSSTKVMSGVRVIDQEIERRLYGQIKT